MVQPEISVRKRRTHRHKHRHKQRRHYGLVRYLFPISVFLFLVVACITTLLPVEDKQTDSSTVNIPVSNEPIQSDLPQDPPEHLTVSVTITTDSWKLVLVNPWTPLPPNHSIQTVTLKNGLQVDERCYPDLQAMMDACRADGLSPVICSAYRTQEKQESLYQAEVVQWLARGYSQDNAEIEAGKAVAIPGTSEHQLGLAVDIVDINNQHLDQSQENTEVQKWLMEHSWEYGFILRYPTGKSEITGIIYEPWHYRYVGREDAEQIHTLDVCLEEYLEGAF